MRDGELTGNFCHKRNLIGQMVLWVEYQIIGYKPDYFTRLKWRKADDIDASELQSKLILKE